MPVATTELVLFGIQAGLRLGAAVRRAYVDQARQRALTLPLPLIDLRPDVIEARDFFDRIGARFVEEDDRLGELHRQAAEQRIRTEEDPGARAYLEKYALYRAIHDAQAEDRPVPTTGSQPNPTPEALHVLVRFKQWEEEDPNRPKPLRRLLGTVIDVGIDYFAHVPGALETHGRHRKAVEAFVQGVERLSFAEVLAEEDPVERVLGRLFVASLEVIADQPEIVSDDPRVREVVSVTTDALGRDILAALKDASDDFERRGLADWSELVFRSALRSGVRHALEHPNRILGVKGEPEGALIGGVGAAALDLVVTETGLEPERLFSRAGLEGVVEAALEVVAEHPTLVTDTDKRAIRSLVSAVAKDLAAMPRVLDLDLAPDVARIVLARTAERIDLIWPDADPQSHLLLTAAKTTIEILTAERPTGGVKRIVFGRDEVLTVVEAVMDELAANPAWLLRRADGVSDDLRAALEASLRVVRRRGGRRLGRKLAAETLSAGVRAVALRREFLDEAPGGRPLVAAAIDATLAELFKVEDDDPAAWRLLREGAVIAIVGGSLAALAESRIDAEAVATLRRFTKGKVQAALANEPIDLEAWGAELGAALRKEQEA